MIGSSLRPESLKKSLGEDLGNAYRIDTKQVPWNFERHGQEEAADHDALRWIAGRVNMGAASSRANPRLHTGKKR